MCFVTKYQLVIQARTKRFDKDVLTFFKLLFLCVCFGVSFTKKSLLLIFSSSTASIKDLHVQLKK